MNPLIIRTEANFQVGSGHFMRCLAIAQAYKEGGDAPIFVLSDCSDDIQNRLEDEGIGCIINIMPSGSHDDAIQTVNIARSAGASWVVVDGYQFNSEFQYTLKKNGLNVLFIDDFGHSEHYWADILINQNIYADDKLYPSRESYTKLLLGLQFALIRKEFRIWRYKITKIPEVAKKILVTFGGVDQHNVTLKAIQGICGTEMGDIQVKVIIGANNPHVDLLKEAASISPVPIELIKNVQNMPELMAWSDVALSSGGVTTTELAFMGIPTISISIAENQRLNSEKLCERGLLWNLGWYREVSNEQIASSVKRLLESPEDRIRLMTTGQEIVDGKGVFRILEEIQNSKNEE